MRIDRGRAKEAFEEYVSHYDRGQEKVRLKIEHTFRVCGLCETIARSLSMEEQDADLAWLIGLLHDAGRFEQLERYGTFIDSQSIDHAAFGADILFKEGRIRDYLEDSGEDALIEAAVRFHSAYRLPEGLTDRMKLFCNLIRDADKIDILRVNVEFPLEEIYNVSTKELRSGQVTAEVMESFEEERAVLRSLKKTAVDHVVGHISLVYELVFPESRRIILRQGYLEKMMNFESYNPVTEKQFEHIREKMTAFLSRESVPAQKLCRQEAQI